MASQQGIVTVNGYVGGPPRKFGQDDRPMSVFNMGTTRSFFSQTSGKWVDLPTIWLKVRAFRSLALNVMDSIKKGDPVIVTGQIGLEEWTDKDGNQQTSIVINATNIGHDLNTGRSMFVKIPRNNTQNAQNAQYAQNSQNNPQYTQNVQQNAQNDPHYVQNPQNTQYPQNGPVPNGQPVAPPADAPEPPPAEFQEDFEAEPDDM